jgi:hypothetical protein
VKLADEVVAVADEGDVLAHHCSLFREGLLRARLIVLSVKALEKQQKSS